jgi:hypothetical protein
VTTTTPRLNVAVALLALAAIAALLLLGDDSSLHFIQKASGYATSSKGVQFPEARQFLENLQGGLAPLAIPAAAMSLTAGGVLMLMGNQNAQRVLFGAIGGAALVFLGPQILA